jgi:predicted phosphodiesterase
MRVLVVSDIHGNLAALEAVLGQDYDALVCLGDLVGYGPCPGPVLRLLRVRANLILQGNHDRALAEGVAPGCRPAFERLAHAVFPLGQRQLTADEIAYLGALPRQATRTFDGVRYHFLHATPSDSLYRYLGPDPTQWAREVTGIETEALIVGHTHIQFDLRVDGKRVVNPGSVGQPKDGDPGAAYAILERGEIHLERVAYPVEQTLMALEQAGIPSEPRAVLEKLLRTGQVPPELTGSA